MNGSIIRPTYFEGQLLAAADLSSAVDYGRAKRERHDRYQHRWGIVTGLDLATEDAQDASGRAFKQVFVAPGLAVDGTGREILLSERLALDPERFRQIQGENIDEAAFYPVFLLSQFRPERPGARPLGLCERRESALITEGLEIRFGRLGDEAIIDEQLAPALSGAPTPPEGTTQWFTLLGFVQWDKAVAKFKGAAPSSGSARRRYAGVNAATVAAQAGELTLQTQPLSSFGKPILRLSDDNGGELCFGRYTGPGQLEELLKITSQGDVTAAGNLSGRLTTGGVMLESGIATDGTILPLPPGITQEQIDDGSATVHVLVSPRIDPAFGPSGPPADWAVMVQECRVDADRRLICRICWFLLDFGAGPNQGQQIESRPGACEYLVLGTTTASGGAP